MPKTVGRAEKFIVYALSGTCDLVQIILDFFAVGAVANRIIDVVVGLLLLLYGALRGLWTGRKLMILLATFAGEQIPLVDAMPFWVLDVMNIYSGTSPKVTEEETSANLPLNNNGVRLPARQNEPLYSDGVGRVRE